jgi:septum formation protein
LGVRQPSFPVILASSSPRRRELLAKIVPNFEVIPPDVDEDALTVPDPVQTAQRLAREKALAVQAARPECLVIAGDTVVAIEDEGGQVQLGKPRSEDDALRILRLLQGRSHQVTTGVCLVWPGGFSAFSETSTVHFRAAGDDELKDYISTGEPMDKAGAYGLQGGGARFLDRIEGSVENVIGLPLDRLAEALKAVSG